MPKYICSGCKSNFYADRETEDFEIKDKFFCSYCYPKVKLCGVCGEIKVFSKDVRSDVGICKDCRIKIGSFPNVWLMLRFKTFTKDGYTCRYCGRSPLKDKNVVLHCDHIIPKSRGGEDKLENLVTSCGECNVGKVDVLLNEYQINFIKNRDIYNANPQPTGAMPNGQV